MSCIANKAKFYSSLRGERGKVHSRFNEGSWIFVCFVLHHTNTCLVKAPKRTKTKQNAKHLLEK